MPNQTTVTESYLMGIKDERAFMNECKARGDTIDDLMQYALAIAGRAYARGFSGDILEYMKGGCDFWRNQLKIAKGSAQRAESIQ